MKIKSFFLTSFLFSKLRKYKYRFKRKKAKGEERLTLNKARLILIDSLGVKKGSSIFVHCGFGFLNAEFTPCELIDLLKDIVGENGNIMMPFYPPGLSLDWARSGRIFDNEVDFCSTGVLAQTLSSENSQISIHPIKSVCAWGKDAAMLVSGHENSIYPYDENSPYVKFSKLDGSLSIGLGVTNCSMIHAAEDLFEDDKSYLYSKYPYELKVKTNCGLRVVTTYVHHIEIKLSSSYEFFKKHIGCQYNYQLINNVDFYSIDNSILFENCERIFQQGESRK